MASAVNYVTDPNTLAQLNASNTSAPISASNTNYVTDPAILSQLNAGIVPQQNTSGLATFMRAMPGGALQPVLNLLHAPLAASTDIANSVRGMFGDPSQPIPTAKTLLPSLLQPSQQELQQHPNYAFAGNLTGSALPYAASDTELLKAVPELEKVAGGSKLANLVRLSARGFASGAALAPAGSSLEQGLIGAAIPPLAVGAGKTIGKVGSEIAGIPGAVKNLINPLSEIANNAQAADLGIGADQDAILRHGILQGTENIKAPIRAMYQARDNSLEGKTVTLPNNINGQDISDALNSLRISIPTNIEGTEADMVPSGNETDDGIDSSEPISKNPNEVPATDAIKIWKAARDRAGIAFKKMRTSNLMGGEAARLQYETQYKSLNPIATALRGTLESQIPDELALSDKADQLWGQNVSPITKNSIYKTAQKSNPLPKNIITKLSASDPSNSAVRQIILNEPSLAKAALAKTYGSNVGDMLNRNDVAQPYIEASPSTKQLLDKQQIAANMNRKTALKTLARGAVGTMGLTGLLEYGARRSIWDNLFG